MEVVLKVCPSIVSTEILEMKEEKKRMSIFQKIRQHTNSGPRPGTPPTNTPGSQSPAETRSRNVPATQEVLPEEDGSLNPDTIGRFQRRFPNQDPLLEYYSCAWDREILWQGRLYITSSSLCFYANIFGNEIKQVILLSEVISLEKAKTAGLFPNAIKVSTESQKFLFCSFLKRDIVYDFVKGLWTKTTDLDSILEKECESKKSTGSDIVGDRVSPTDTLCDEGELEVRTGVSSKKDKLPWLGFIMTILTLIICSVTFLQYPNPDIQQTISKLQIAKHNHQTHLILAYEKLDQSNSMFLSKLYKIINKR